MRERNEARGQQTPTAGRLTVTLAALGALLAATVALALIDPTASCALPALALPLLLALRRYPGAGLLASLSPRRRSRHARQRSAPLPVRIALSVPRGGLLLARSLANRPPPALSLATS